MSSIPLTGASVLQPATAASLNASSSAAATAASTATSSANGLTQTNFLQLLMAQMKNQDPSSPTSPTDYVTQMAEFTSVQGINQLNQSITSLLSMQGLGQGVSLIGKSVTYTNSAGQSASGTVSSVTMVGGQPQLVINNTNVGLSQIQTVQAAAKKNTAGAASTTN
jgi:flagellar basal-body rod modification protein FlgD